MLSFAPASTHGMLESKKKKKIRPAPGCISEALQSFLLALSVPLRKHELFTLLKCPNCLPWGHSLGRPGRTQLRARGPPSRGYSNWLRQRRGEQLPVSWWAALGPGASGCLQPARFPRLGRDASEIAARAGRAGPRGGGIPGEWGPGPWASSLTRRHPGDTGAPSSRYPAFVDSCAPLGEVPRRPQQVAAGPGARPERLLQVVPPPGENRVPSLPGA